MLPVFFSGWPLLLFPVHIVFLEFDHRSAATRRRWLRPALYALGGVALFLAGGF